MPITQSWRLPLPRETTENPSDSSNARESDSDGSP